MFERHYKVVYNDTLPTFEWRYKDVDDNFASFLMGHHRPLYRLFYVFSNNNAIYLYKLKSMLNHLVSNTGIGTFESPPITTLPGHPTYLWSDTRFTLNLVASDLYWKSVFHFFWLLFVVVVVVTLAVMSVWSRDSNI